MDTDNCLRTFALDNLDKMDEEIVQAQVKKQLSNLEGCPKKLDTIPNQVTIICLETAKTDTLSVNLKTLDYCD